MALFSKLKAPYINHEMSINLTIMIMFMKVTIIRNYDSHFRVAGVKFISLLSLFSHLIHEPL